jgi:hypothetical protein
VEATSAAGKVDGAIVSFTTAAAPAVTTAPQPSTGGQSSAGPAVTSLQRFGFHAQATRLVLTFNAPLEPTRAQNVASYELFDSAGRPIPLTSAVYDPAARTVTLAPSERLDIHRQFKLVVIGTGPNGITDTTGNLLNGLGSAQPGSSYTKTFGFEVLAGRTASPAQRIRKRSIHGGLGTNSAPHSSPVILERLSPQAVDAIIGELAALGRHRTGRAPSGAIRVAEKVRR